MDNTTDSNQTTPKTLSDYDPDQALQSVLGKIKNNKNAIKVVNFKDKLVNNPGELKTKLHDIKDLLTFGKTEDIYQVMRAIKDIKRNIPENTSGN